MILRTEIGQTCVDFFSNEYAEANYLEDHHVVCADFRDDYDSIDEYLEDVVSDSQDEEDQEDDYREYSEDDEDYYG